MRFCGNTKDARFIHHQLACPFEAHCQAFGKLVYGVVLLDHLDHPLPPISHIPNRARQPRRSPRLHRHAQHIREIVRPAHHALRVDRIHVEHTLLWPHIPEASRWIGWIGEADIYNLSRRGASSAWELNVQDRSSLAGLCAHFLYSPIVRHNSSHAKSLSAPY